MNERLKELADRAGFVRYSAEEDPNTPIDWSSDYSVELQRLYELIVRECMDCAAWVGKVNKNPVEPVHTSHAIKLRIQKRFGVE